MFFITFLTVMLFFGSIIYFLDANLRKVSSSPHENTKLTEAEKIETQIYQIYYQKSKKTRGGYDQRAIDRAKRSKDPIKELNEILDFTVRWSKL